jgi:cation transport regulator ChaC
VSWYFAYGSNMVVERMRERGVPFISSLPAVLRDQRLVFDKRGRDGSARANVARARGERTFGVLYELAGEALDVLAQFESGYDLVDVAVEVARPDGGVLLVQARTFVARSDRRTAADPTRSYVELILEGAREHGLPEAAKLEILKAAAGRKDEPH